MHCDRLSARSGTRPSLEHCKRYQTNYCAKGEDTPQRVQCVSILAAEKELERKLGDINADSRS